MGWWNIDILYQMFKKGVVYRVTSDAGIHGGPYRTGGKTQDQIAIEREKERREKYAKTNRKQQQKKADKEKETQKLIQTEKEACKKKLEVKEKKIEQLKLQQNKANDETRKLKQQLEDANNAQNVDQIQTKLDKVSRKKDESDKELQKVKEEARTLEQEMSDLNKKLQDQQNEIDQQNRVALELEQQKQSIRQELESLKRKANEEKRKAELEQTPEGREQLKTEADDRESGNVVSDDLMEMASSWYDSELKVELSNYLTNSGKAKLDALQTSLQQETELGDINTSITAADIMPEGPKKGQLEAKLKNARAILYALAESAQKNRSETTDKTFQEELEEDWGDENDLTDLLDENRAELGTGFITKDSRRNHLQNAIKAINAIFKKQTRSQLEKVFLDKKFDNALINEPMDDLHPFVMKPAAPQLHMQKLHMQTSMEKLDLEPAMETVPDDVHVQAVQPMKCGKAMKVEPVACAKHETEHAHGDMKCKHEAAEGKITKYAKKKAKEMAEKAKNMEKKSGKSTLGQIGEAIFGRQHCDSCGELHDGDHDCEVEAFQAMLDGYDSEGQALEKPRCASVGLANRKLNELH